MKHNNIFKIFDWLEIYNEIHILKLIHSPYNITSYILMKGVQNWSHWMYKGLGTNTSNWAQIGHKWFVNGKTFMGNTKINK